jgi:galactose oxidase-like protein/Kelch motif protein
MSRISRISLALIALIPLLMTSSFSPTSVAPGRVVRAASMHDRRADHSSTLLPDGRVLITGGMVENGVFLNSAELFDPSKGTFVSTASMQSHRVGHSATLLPNGKVLIAGGLAGRKSEGGPGIVATTEIYDPATGRFSAGPSMSMPRTGHAAVLLPSGKVLLAGGAGVDESRGECSEGQWTRPENGASFRAL